MGDQLVVGFDLDMTLIDTVVGFAATLDALGTELGVEFPTAEMTSKLGPPLDLLLEPHLPADQIPAAADRFREIYPDIAVAPTPAFPGVADALAAVRRHHGRIILVTGKHTPNAQLHVDHLGLDVDVVEGRVWGTGKGEVLRRHEADIYVGDHVHDVEGARAAGVTSVSVLTGGSTREQLLAAGHRRGAHRPRRVPRVARRHICWRRRLADLHQRLQAHQRLHGRVQRGSRQRLPARGGGRALGAGNVTAATAYSDSLPVSERGPAHTFAESLGVEVLTPRTAEMEREGYRAQRRRPVRVLQGRTARRARPLVAAEHGCDAVATGTNADDARAGFRPASPRQATAGP